MQKPDIVELKSLSAKARKLIVQLSSESGSSHVGGNLSCIDIVMSALAWIKIQSHANHSFHLSKGHSALAFYAAKNVLGELSDEEISNYGKSGSPLSAHLNSSDILGVELSTGSLGHALSFAVGKQIGSRALKEDNVDIVCLSDGELNEGSIWEAVQLAGHLKLGNLIVFVDKNNLQSLGTTQETINLDPLASKFEVFGWAAFEINGHDFGEIVSTLPNESAMFEKPSAIICNTIKGKGVSFMENNVSWHYQSPSTEELIQALEELS